MASLIISSTTVEAMSRATPSQANQLVVPFNGLKLSPSAVTQTHASSLVAPFTGLKSNSEFPIRRKVNNITSLSSNGGKAQCLDPLLPSALKFAQPASWLENGNAREFCGGDLTNWGEVDVSKLHIGLQYQVLYYVTMKMQPVNSTLKLTLELANGSRTETNTAITVLPVNLTAIRVGKFTNLFSVGKIKFTFSSDEADKWKGLIIQTVVVTF